MDKVEAAAKSPSKLADSFDKAGKSAMSFANSTEKLTTAQAKVAVAASKVGVAEAQAAQAIKKADDAASKGNKSAQDLALAQAKAALAADKVKLAQTQADKALQKATVGMGKQKAVASSAGQAIAKMENETRKFASSMSSAIGKVASFASSLSKIKSAASSAKSSVSGLGMSVLDLGTKLGMSVIGIQALAQGAIDLGSAMLNPHAQIESLEAGLSSLLKSDSAVDQMMADLKEFAALAPQFDLVSAGKGAQKLLAMGFAAEEVKPLMYDIGNAIAAMQGSAADLTDVAVIFGQINAVGKLTWENLQQLAERGFVNLDEMAKNAGMSTKQLMDNMSKGAIDANTGIELIRKTMLQMSGDDAMAKQAKTFDGAVSNMKANATDLWVTLSAPIFDKVKEGIVGLNTLLENPAIQEFAEGAGKAIASFFENTSKWVGTFMESVSKGDGLTNLVNSFQRLGEVLNFGPALENVNNLLAQFFSQSGAEGAGQATNDAFNGIATTINFLSDAIKSGQEAWTNMQPALEKVGAFMTETFAPVWDNLVSTINDQIIPAWDNLVKGIQPVMPQLEIFGAIVAGLVVGIFGGLIGMLAAILDGVITFVGGVITYFSGLIQFWSGFIAFIVALFTGDFEGMWKALQVMWEGGMRMIEGVWKMIEGIFKVFVGSIQGFVDGFVKAIVGFFTWLWDELVGHSIIPDMVNGILKWFGDLGKNGLKAIQDFVSNIQKAIQDFAAKCLQFGKDIVNNIINGINSLAGNIGAAIKGALKGAAASVGITIPGLATGVENFSGGLAVVGERGPELVSLPRGSSVYPMSSSPTPSRSSGSFAMSSGGGGSQNMTVILELDGDVIGAYAAQYIDKKVRLKFGSGARGRG